MREITKEELDDILAKHEKWLKGEEGGERADLSHCNLSYCNLSHCNLSRANLSHCDLSHCNLRRADLSYCNLSHCNLSRANLSYCNLSHCNLRRADLSLADLSHCNLSRANIDYSCWPLWCGSLNTKADDKIVIQLLYHVLRLAKNSEINDELKAAIFTQELIKQANRFHLVKECGEIEKED